MEVSSWNATVSDFSKFLLSNLQCNWSGTTPIFKISMFYCSFPVISLTRTLVGWSDVLSLINTDSTAFQRPRQFRARFFLRPSLRVGSGVQTICITTSIYIQASNIVCLLSKLSLFWVQCITSTVHLGSGHFMERNMNNTEQ